MIAGIAAPALGAAPTPFYLGSWMIVSAEPGPWRQGILAEDARLEPAAKWKGSRIVFAPHSVDGPIGVACPHAHYSLDGQTARQLFDSRLNGIDLPKDAPKDQADASGEHYSPIKLAEHYGFKGFSWKTLQTACHSGQYFVFANPTAAVFNDDDIVLVMRRE